MREIWDLRSANVPMSLVNSTSSTRVATLADYDDAVATTSKRWSNQEPKTTKDHAGDDMGPVLLPLRGEIAK